ncbi:MAG TPA: hypothetical protein VGI32_04590 [Steroidobacteraceae bacterium]|jgi:hypothetical protein
MSFQLSDVARSAGVSVAWISAGIGLLFIANSALIMFLPTDGGDGGFTGVFIGSVFLVIGVAAILQLRKRANEDAAGAKGKSIPFEASSLAGLAIAIAIAVTVLSWRQVRLWLAPTEQIAITSQMRIPQTHVEAHLIVDAPGGDFIIAGTRKTDHYHAWASRVNSKGEYVWEFIDKVPDGLPSDIAQASYLLNQSKINSAVTLADGSTLLCGGRYMADRHTIPFLVHLDAAGRFIEERDVIPGHQGDLLVSGIQCVRWGEGIAVSGGLSNPGIGWLLKLDAALRPLWEKFGAEYSGDAIEIDGHHLVMAGLIKLDEDGNIVARNNVLGGQGPRIRPLTPSSRIRLALMISPTKSLFMNFDQNLLLLSQRSEPSMRIEKAYELADRSLIVFGYPDGARANVTRVYNNGGARNYLLDPNHGGSFQAAAAGSKPNEFVTVRQIDFGDTVIERISIGSSIH